MKSPASRNWIGGARLPLRFRRGKLRELLAELRLEFPRHLGHAQTRREGMDRGQRRAEGVGGFNWLAGFEEDLAAAGRLAARATSMGFADLLRSYYAENSKVSEQQVAQFTHGVLAASVRADRSIDAWRGMQAAPASSGPSPFLDIGCGTGPLAIAAARRGSRVTAVDVGMRWLVLARERCREAGVAVSLVCANAETLPLRDGTFDVVAGESVIENLADQARALSEAARVLRSRGALWLSMPNKRSVGPDPHLGLPALGWFPDGVAAWYARRIGAVPPRRRLLSGGGLRTLLAPQGFADIRVALPSIDDAQRVGLSPLVAAGVDGYHVMKGLPVFRQLLEIVGPSLLVTARRS